jgi:DNA-binding NarL/FixJ family response regulator
MLMLAEIQKVIIVDDNQGFIDAIKLLLNRRKDMEIIAEANNAEQFFSLMKSTHANMVLMDINLPDINGIVAAKRALIHDGYLKIIGVTMSDDFSTHLDMLRTGFKAGILKSNFSRGFDEALQTINNGGVYFPVLN